MANKAISELPQAQNVNNQDLFVLEQSGIAKKLTAETFITEQGIIDALAEALDGHGGISSVTLSSVSGRIRTYLITFTDGTSTTFQVLDGTTIQSIAKTSTSGLVDTYTVYMSDGTTSFFNVTNGSSITSVQKTSTSGLVDTYTITLSNGTTQTFTVTNGERGPEGPAGDYAGIVGRDSLIDAASDDELLIYDISAELEKKITVSDLEKGVFSNLAWVENGTTASRAYSVGDYVTINGVLCKITAAVASGGTLTDGTNYTQIGGNGGLGKSLIDTTATKQYLGLVSSTSSPKDFTLKAGHFYLIYSFHNTQTNYNGMYYVIAGSSSLTGRVYPIIDATALTITLSQNVMTVSSNLSQAGRLYAVDIGNYNMT